VPAGLPASPVSLQFFKEHDRISCNLSVVFVLISRIPMDPHGLSGLDLADQLCDIETGSARPTQGTSKFAFIINTINSRNNREKN
jgi:hypothetical protein